MIADEGEGAKYWPRWRGPSGQGVATGTNYVDTWSPSQNILWKAQVPHMDLELELMGVNFEPLLKAVIIPMIFLIEVLGLFIKHFVLSVRLLANMMAGHIVLSVIVAFIVVTHGTGFWHVVWPVSVLGATALSLLELFVAFLQAYIFVFLSALFIGMAVHSH